TGATAWMRDLTTARPWLEWHIALAGCPLAVAIFLLVQTLHIGLVGRHFREDAREWWARLGGLLAFGTLAVTALVAIALDGPWLIDWLVNRDSHWWLAAASTGWAGLTSLGLYLGR